MAKFNDDERKRLVQRVVREAIKAEDGRDLSVTQDTSIGASGLGHECPIRRRYLPRIQRELKKVGCRLKTLLPSAFCAADVVRVRDVTALVLKDMKC